MRLSERTKSMLALGSLSLTAVCFEFAFLFVNAPLAPSGPVAALIDRGIENVRASRYGAPGISVAIVRNGKIAYTYASGLADVASRRSVTTFTRFRVGSISKMFTAVVMMQLVEAGRVKLDATVSAYLPEAPHATEITIRQLLSHTSGLPNVLDMALTTDVAKTPTASSAMLDPLVGHPLDFAPGERFEYSNVNYVVLGAIIERLDARPLGEVERDQIFAPAGMAETSTATRDDATAAIGYDDATGSKPAADYDPSWLFASADVATTASDLARFDIALMDGKLVTRRTLAEMQRIVSNTGDGTIDYGLGLMLYPFGSREVAGHHGQLPGFASDDEMIVGNRFALIVLSNATRTTTARIATLVLGALFPLDFVTAQARAVRTVPPTDAPTQASSKMVTPLPPSSALP